MTDSKRSHWQSLAADLGRNTSEDQKSADSIPDSVNSAADVGATDVSAQIVDPHASIDNAAQDTAVIPEPQDNPVVAEAPPRKKKKRASWAFWRSGNKNIDADEQLANSTDSAVSDDPLTLLNQAETTDDMACAIDQLFSNSGGDTRDDDLVFDTDEIATSLDFDEESKVTREADSEDERQKRRPRERGRQGSRRRGENDDRSRGNSRRSNRDGQRERSSDEHGAGNRKARSRTAGRRDEGQSTRDSERRHGRRQEKTPRQPVDHGDVPTWDTAVSFVVDNNMATRKSKSSGKQRRRSGSKNKSRE